MYPDSSDKAAIFLNAFPIINGTVASIGYPASSDNPTKFLIPAWNCVSNEAGLMLNTSFGTIAPLS